MPIDQVPFRPYELDESKKIDSFTVRLNKEERAKLEACKKTLEQRKDSTTLKQLAWIGEKVLHGDLMGSIIGTLFKNKAKNKVSGVSDFE